MSRILPSSRIGTLDKKKRAPTRVDALKPDALSFSGPSGALHVERAEKIVLENTEDGHDRPAPETT